MAHCYHLMRFIRQPVCMTHGGKAQGLGFNCSKSGWFDQVCFNDWFMETALPHLKNLGGKTVIIGDILSSHYSVEVSEACEDNNISFDFLPAHSTHMTYLTQPLDWHFCIIEEAMEKNIGMLEVGQSYKGDQ